MSDNQQWVPCGVAYMLLGDELARRMACDPTAARNKASLELKALLEAGRLTARARGGEVQFRLEMRNLYKSQKVIQGRRKKFAEHKFFGDIFKDAHDRPALTIDMPKYDDDITYDSNDFDFIGPGKVLPEFWECVEDNPYSWATGDFYLRGGGWLSGVEFELQGLPCADQIAQLLARTAPAIEPALPAPRPQANKAGRPAAGWWPDFAAALALYVHREGLPPNEPGAIAQVIGGVCDWMAEAGMGQPSETQVRPAIRALLERYWNETGQL